MGEQIKKYFMKKQTIALIAILMMGGLFYGCEKNETAIPVVASTPTTGLKTAGPNPGQGSGFSIWIDGKKNPKTGKCCKSYKLHLCADWPWGHLLERSELEKMKSSYMVPVHCNTEESTVDMMFNYSFLSTDEIEMVESDLENMQELEFPSVNIKADIKFESTGLMQDISLIEGSYPIISWSREERTFLLTIDYIPIEIQ